MKIFFLVCLVATFSHFASAQPILSSNKVDSLKKALDLTNADTNTVKILVKLSGNYRWSSPNTAIKYCMRGIPLAQKLNMEVSEIVLWVYLGDALGVKGDFSVSLQKTLNALKLAEKLNNEELINLSNFGIGSLFLGTKKYSQALSYLNKIKTKKIYLIGKEREEVILAFIGETHFQMNHLDSALHYVKKSYDLDIKNPDFSWPLPSFYLAQIYSKQERYTASLEYYKKGISISLVTLDTIDGYNGMASVFYKIGQIDSAIYFAKEAIILAQKGSFAYPVINASSLLTDIYRSTNQVDSAFKYQELVLKCKETLFSQDKIIQLELLSFNEQQRQLEIQKEKIKAAEVRETNLQLIFIAVFIINFFLLVLILSRRKVKAKTVEIMGLLALLLLFEFIFLFIHPYIEEWTNHTPIYMLLILVGIASVLVPMHHKLIDWVRTKLVQYNKLQLAENKPIQPNEKDEDQPIDY